MKRSKDLKNIHKGKKMYKKILALKNTGKGKAIHISKLRKDRDNFSNKLSTIIYRNKMRIGIEK